MNTTTIPLSLTPLPSEQYVDLIPLDEWEELTSFDAIVPEDGDGYWATPDGESTLSAFSSLPPPEWATHVAYYAN